MGKRPGNKPNRPAETVTVLSISPLEEDHISLERIFNRSEWSEDTESRWVLHAMPTLESALKTLRENRISIVVAERDLLPGTWRDVLAEIGTRPDPPLLIVTSRLADERLWAEALNLGAYDVLAKPFEVEEVVRVLSFAWKRRKNGPEI
jgi:DNA-binding response OmpR family regulator